MTEVGYTVSDLERSIQFFVGTLGAEHLGTREVSGEELAALTDLTDPSARVAHLAVGTEHVALTAYDKPGKPYPRPAASNDLDFQHLALVVSDMNAAHREVAGSAVTAVSQNGPERIPKSNVAAAGIRAFYFRELDAHPLELIWYPPGKGQDRWQKTGNTLVLGIDHTAIAVSNTESSLAFYRDLLGFRIAGHSLNEGIEQERLSGVPGARVRITGLASGGGPGVELLEYLSPGPGRPRPTPSNPRDLFHWEITVEVRDLEAIAERTERSGFEIRSQRIAHCEACVTGGRALLVADPDGHVVRLVQRP